jgi:predicted aspartyl protease
MRYNALTIASPGIAQNILMPVVIQQSKSICQAYHINSDAVDVYALLDTGASVTCISQTLADKLNLKTVGQGIMDTAGGIHKTNLYYIDLLMRNDISFINIQAMEFTGSKRFDILIGMDILTLGDLAITNAGQRTVISFRVPPDTRHIDYAAMDKNPL